MSIERPEKTFRPMSLHELADRPLQIKRFVSRITQEGQTDFTRWNVVSVSLEKNQVEFRLSHKDRGMKDVILKDGRLIQKWDGADITDQFTPETVGGAVSRKQEKAA